MASSGAVLAEFRGGLGLTGSSHHIPIPTAPSLHIPWSRVDDDAPTTRRAFCLRGQELTTTRRRRAGHSVWSLAEKRQILLRNRALFSPAAKIIWSGSGEIRQTGHLTGTRLLLHQKFVKLGRAACQFAGNPARMLEISGRSKIRHGRDEANFQEADANTYFRDRGFPPPAG